MGFLDKFIKRGPAASLPSLDALLEGKALPFGPEDLAPHMEAFEHLQDAAHREAWAAALGALAAKGLPLPSVWDEAQEEILPELVPAWVPERDGGFNRLCIEGLRLRLRVSDRILQPADLTLWDISDDTAVEQALEHLKRRSANKIFERLPSGVYRGPWRDGLDAARLLLPDLWKDIFKDQRPFMAVPNPGCLLFAPQVLLPKLVEAVSQELGKGPLLQAALFERVGDQWLPARVQEPHPIAFPQRELKSLDLTRVLQVQNQDLDPALGQPAPMGTVRGQDGRPLTVATWTAGDPCLLPSDCDLIGFMTADGAPLGIYWRQSLPRLAELKGEAVAIWGPRRLRFERFPTGEEREVLERFADAKQMLDILKGQGQTGRPAPKPGPDPNALPAHLRDQLGVQSED
ncbi:MAG TPA: hypothetical protein VFF76_11045 [Holophagaceae bacterium]|jgi:hypothetical protein|nr:hypothetical protein [Holophagaceae bacterium]